MDPYLYPIDIKLVKYYLIAMVKLLFLLYRGFIQKKVNTEIILQFSVVLVL